MYYTIVGNEVVVHNTPWGEQRYPMTFPPGVYGGNGAIYVGKDMRPRIKISYDREHGVTSVTVDGKPVPSKARKPEPPAPPREALAAPVAPAKPGAEADPAAPKAPAVELPKVEFPKDPAAVRELIDNLRKDGTLTEYLKDPEFRKAFREALRPAK
jgi:hypothetical protein